MEFRKLDIAGLFEVTLSPFTDERGFFMRVYDADEFARAGLHREWVQENHSGSVRKGVIRGVHFQREPYAETKLVRCIRGTVFDVAVDLRPGSPDFGRWRGIVLSEENRKMLYIPKGFGHGFCTMSDLSEVVYKVDNRYSPDDESGILWSDMDLAIEWPLEGEPVVSAKDSRNMTFREYSDICRHGKKGFLRG